MSPLGGTVTAANTAVLADPDLAVRDPFDAGWLLELDLDRDGPVPGAVAGEEALAWYESVVAAHCELAEGDR